MVESSGSDGSAMDLQLANLNTTDSPKPVLSVNLVL